MINSTEEERTGKCIMLKSFGGYEKLAVSERKIPNLLQGQVLVNVKACGMNFSDQYVRQGLYTHHSRKPPFVMGIECSGIVEGIAEGVNSIKVGDRVLCWDFNYGLWTEFAIIHEQNCFVIPESMSFEDAAAFTVNFVTAYFALHEFGSLKPGNSILIQSAAGGVGWAATQLAKLVDNVTIYGTASSKKHEAILSNGITHAIDYRKDNFLVEVAKLAPTGLNIVLDCLSGSDFVQSSKLLKPFGRLIHIGMSNIISGEKMNVFKAAKLWWQSKSVSMVDLIMGNQSVCGLSIATVFEKDPEIFKNALQHLLSLYVEDKIKPHIDSVWCFEEVQVASDHMIQRQNIGKIILVPHKSNERSV